MRPLSNAVIHPNLPAVHLNPIHRVPRLRSIIDRFIVDESKAAASTTVAVQYNLRLLDRSKLPELLVKLPLGGVETQPKHSDTFRLFRSITIAVMTTSVRHG